jgi:hypothetical protein
MQYNCCKAINSVKGDMQIHSETTETVAPQPDAVPNWRSQLSKPLRSIWVNLSQIGNLLQLLDEDQPERW